MANVTMSIHSVNAVGHPNDGEDFPTWYGRVREHMDSHHGTQHATEPAITEADARAMMDRIWEQISEATPEE